MLPTPALLNMIESPPMVSAADRTASASASASVTSTTRAGPPISSAVARAPSASMSRTATVAPSSAMRRQVARPMPEAPPVTTAARPSSKPIRRTVLRHVRDADGGPGAGAGWLPAIDEMPAARGRVVRLRPEVGHPGDPAAVHLKEGDGEHRLPVLGPPE